MSLTCHLMKSEWWMGPYSVGTVGFADGKVQILHPILETLQLDWKEIRYLEGW